MSAQIGEQFVRGIAERDAAALLEILAPQVDFRAMTPGRFWEADSATGVVNDVILGMWFEPDDQVETIEAIEHDVVADRERVGYRFRGRNATGQFVVEQQAYFMAEDGAITWLRVMCSGFRAAT